MNVLLLGSGGREHALAWKMAQSPLLGKLYIAPGNAGTSQCGTNVAMSATDFEAIRNFVLANAVTLVVVGPEDPLVRGIRDFFLADEQLRHIPVIGPGKTGAQLEGSKDFSKQFMFRHGIPTAAYQTFTKETLNEGLAFLETLRPPYVLKADGLAAGKGVVIPHTLADAKAELTAMLAEAKFGDASSKVVIEEFLQGIELSVFVLTDGISYKMLPAAKDYKRIGEHDEGLNTGGMGAVSPVPFADAAFLEKVENRIVKPTISGLRSEGIDYAGFIFIGLMNDDGDPKVIEYNCRMGDPETEVVIPRIQSDLLAVFEAVGKQQLSKAEFSIDPRTATTVMMVSGGYPGDYAKGKVITGLGNVQNALAFHAGTAQKDGEVVTAGGRVLAFTAFGHSIEEALHLSYSAAGEVSFDGHYYRRDIGQDLIRYMERHKAGR
ncbi:MAG: phosphoribosylamine--glycine ligase [Bacteroidia bacterium]|jgi:phosphoribosylamine--glycine ligase|nr:phosphoribosylamine--glycine ligase [Bacteroidia bacterium]